MQTEIQFFSELEKQMEDQYEPDREAKLAQELAGAATARAVLERHVMDCRIPKSEAEWWARNRISGLIRVLNLARDTLAAGTDVCDGTRLEFVFGEIDGALDNREETLVGNVIDHWSRATNTFQQEVKEQEPDLFMALDELTRELMSECKG